MERRELTPKQEAYCRYYAVERLSQRQSYISAYGRGNKSDKTIDEAASRLLRIDKILARVKQLQAKLADRVIWAKADMINDLKAMCDECKEVKDADGNPDTKALNTAISAIKTASEILGYKTEKANIESGITTGIKISFVDKSKRKEGKEGDPKIVGEYTNPVDIKEGVAKSGDRSTKNL